MPQLQQLSKQIAQLGPVEREELMLHLVDEVLASRPSWFNSFHGRRAEDSPSIVATPGVCGGAARLIRTRIPVWTIERMRQLGFSEVEILQCYPTLRAVDLVQVEWYAAHHRDEIEKAIRENEEDIADKPCGDATQATRAAATAPRPTRRKRKRK